MTKLIPTSLIAVATAGLFAAATPASAQKVATSTAPRVVQFRYSCVDTVCTTTDQVPVGMRLVVESVIGRVSTYVSYPLFLHVATTLDGGLQEDMEIPASMVATHPGSAVYFNTWTYALRFYSDLAPQMHLNSFVTGAASHSNVTLVGYLVNAN